MVLVPWVKNAKKPESVFMALEKEFCDYSHMRKWVYKELRRSNKPHGRLACTTIVGRLARDFKGYSLGKRQTHAFIDVSIIPCLPR